jgi:hypothetical protein
MKLYSEQLIFYNPDTQRPTKVVVRGDVEYRKISVNQKAVNDIIEAYENKRFIIHQPENPWSLDRGMNGVP